MRTALSPVLIGWLLIALAPAGSAQETAASPAEPPPSLIRVQAEFIEVSQAQLADLMFGEHAPATDGALRQQVGELITQGQASLVETLMVMTQAGRKATAESVREFIYPTKFEPPSAPDEVRSDAKAGQPVPAPRDFAVGPMPSASDSRNLGATLEIEPNLEDNGSAIKLRVVAELIYHVRNEIWAEWKDRRGTAHVQMPILYTVRCNTIVTTASGKFLMVAALSPKNPDGLPDPARKLMLFVKCDLLNTPPAEVAAGADSDSPGKRPPAIRTQVEFIEVSHARFSELMAGTPTVANDDALRAKVGQLIATGEATLVETMMGVGKSGQKGTAESIREFIFATEYEPPELPLIIRLSATDPTDAAELPDLATGPTPAAWDTRNLGSTFEFEPTLIAGNLVDLRIVPEIVQHLGNQVWVAWQGRYGKASVEMPDFYVLRCTTSFTAPVGRYLMAAALSPHDPAGVTDPSRKILVFVKCDVLTASK